MIDRDTVRALLDVVSLLVTVVEDALDEADFDPSEAVDEDVKISREGPPDFSGCACGCKPWTPEGHCVLWPFCVCGQAKKT